ncbi:exo-alpha-sialidase [Candidatus Pacearchaeota archaeon]|nr:exo-alpha-sialidase [Candidatus Pacearchaeota archaeon]
MKKELRIVIVGLIFMIVFGLFIFSNFVITGNIIEQKSYDRNVENVEIREVTSTSWVTPLLSKEGSKFFIFSGVYGENPDKEDFVCREGDSPELCENSRINDYAYYTWKGGEDTNQAGMIINKGDILSFWSYNPNWVEAVNLSRKYPACGIEINFVNDKDDLTSEVLRWNYKDQDGIVSVNGNENINTKNKWYQRNISLSDFNGRTIEKISFVQQTNRNVGERWWCAYDGVNIIPGNVSKPKTSISCGKNYFTEWHGGDYDELNCGDDEFVSFEEGEEELTLVGEFPYISYVNQSREECKNIYSVCLEYPQCQLDYVELSREECWGGCDLNSCTRKEIDFSSSLSDRTILSGYEEVDVSCVSDEDKKIFCVLNAINSATNRLSLFEFFSNDKGESWSVPNLIPKEIVPTAKIQYDQVIYERKNGDYVMVYTQQPSSSGCRGTDLFFISYDNKIGTWRSPSLVADACSNFSNIHWESSIYELSDGTILIADQIGSDTGNILRNCPDLKVKLIPFSSKDNGYTWKKHDSVFDNENFNSFPVFIEIDNYLYCLFENWKSECVLNDENNYSLKNVKSPSISAFRTNISGIDWNSDIIKINDWSELNSNEPFEIKKEVSKHPFIHYDSKLGLSFLTYIDGKNLYLSYTDREGFLDNNWSESVIVSAFENGMRVANPVLVDLEDEIGVIWMEKSVINDTQYVKMKKYNYKIN